MFGVGSALGGGGIAAAFLKSRVDIAAQRLQARLSEAQLEVTRQNNEDGHIEKMIAATHTAMLAEFTRMQSEVEQLRDRLDEKDVSIQDLQTKIDGMKKRELEGDQMALQQKIMISRQEETIKNLNMQIDRLEDQNAQLILQNEEIRAQNVQLTKIHANGDPH